MTDPTHPLELRLAHAEGQISMLNPTVDAQRHTIDAQRGTIDSLLRQAARGATPKSVNPQR